MCKQSICNSSELHIDITRTVDDQIDDFDDIGVL